MARVIVNHELATLITEADITHAALARMIVHQGSTAYGLRLGYDYRSVGRWLGGAVADPPTPELLATVLTRLLRRTITIHQLGFHHGATIRRSLIIPTNPPDTVETVTELWRAAVERRRFLHTSTAFATGLAIEAVLDWRDNPAAASLERRGTRTVTDADVVGLHQAREEFRHLDHAHGGGYALTWLEDYLTGAVDPLLHGRYSDALGRELFVTAATLTDMAGWMAMDAGHQGLAQRFYTQAAGLAKQAGNSAYGAYVLGNLATQALFVGETRTAVRIARSARHSGGRAITSTLTARLAVIEARAHALLGDRHQTRGALHIAERAMGIAEPGRDPDWLGVFTPAHFSGSVMHALRDLGDADAAARHASDALDLPQANTRTRALHTVLHATVLAERGDIDGAVETAMPVQQAAGTLKSHRLGQRLDEFAQRLASHQGTPAVDDYLEADRNRG